jgi:hypothetical protein
MQTVWSPTSEKKDYFEGKDRLKYEMYGRVLLI